MDQNGPKKQQRQQLSKGMEHIRYAVTVDPTYRPKQSPSPSLAEDDNGDVYGVPSSVIQPIRRAPSSRSHDPSNNQKRSDPFQFGSRYLEEGDNIFEFNAWDNVEVDDAYKEFSEQQFAAQRAAPVGDLARKKYMEKPEKYWDLFYSNNAQNFFKDRKWLQQEFPILDQLTEADAGPKVVLEVGAGAGNTAFPVLDLNKNPGLKIHACDYSKKAVELIRNNPKYAAPPVGAIQADVWDVASEELPAGLTEGSADVVLMVFIFSALAPTQWEQAVRNIWRVLKPGGLVLFRDYGRGDLAQVRFKKGRYLGENFYIRGDGTRVYFFDKTELARIWTGKEPMADAPGNDSVEQSLQKVSLGDSTASDGMTDQAKDAPSGSKDATEQFEVVNLGVDRRLLVNRKRKLKMYRCWMQAVFRKPNT